MLPARLCMQKTRRHNMAIIIIAIGKLKYLVADKPAQNTADMTIRFVSFI